MENIIFQMNKESKIIISLILDTNFAFQVFVWRKIA